MEIEARLAEDEQRAEEQQLDAGADQRVDRTRGDGGSRRDALALEEADADGQTGGDGREGEVEVAHRELQRVNGSEGQLHRNSAERRGGLRETRQLCDDSAERDQGPRGACE